MLGHFELVEKVGEGAQGEVWRAKHHVLEFPAAVKVAYAEAGAPALLVDLSIEPLQELEGLRCQLDGWLQRIGNAI